MTREYCLKVAKLKGFDFETARELTTFIKPRRRFDGVVAAWREYLQWKYAGADTVKKRPRNSFFLVDAHPRSCRARYMFYGQRRYTSRRL